jgi:hypothetical protein
MFVTKTEKRVVASAMKYWRWMGAPAKEWLTTNENETPFGPLMQACAAHAKSKRRGK